MKSVEWPAGFDKGTRKIALLVLVVMDSGREGPCDTQEYQTGERNRINLTEDPIAGVDDSTHLK